MDNSTSGIPEKRSLSLSNGPSFRRSTGSRPSSGGSGGGTLDLGAGTAPNHLPHTKIIVYSDEKGYGMKVSGDNPVYVQSVKEGGPAEKAGLHRGDKIIKVNGVTVTHSTHIEVVDLIKSSPYVELTVQQHPAHRSGSLTPLLTSPTTPSSTSPTMASPPPSRPLQHHHSAPARDRITGPQPVDYKKQVELENERLQMTRVMLEHEQNYVEMLRSNLARCHESRQESDLTRQLASAERRVARLQQQIVALTQDKEQPTTILPLSRHVLDLPPGYEGGDTPPPLPTRNPLPPRVTSPSPSLPSSPPSGGVPPPLPPRQYLLQMDKLTSGGDLLLSASSSNNCSMGTPVHKHHRTKSSPDTLNASSMAEASKRLIDTECLHELSIGGAKRTRGGVAWDVESPRSTPPGTPPPPYAVPPASGGGGALPDEICDITPDDTDKAGDHSDQLQQPVGSPPGSVQPPIISMEDDDMSDQEVSQLEDHGPFKSLNKLWAHHAHLAVFMNYVISNSDPSSLLFYLVTDLYKEGNAKEMKKWAYEIHSSFLVPCAPLRLNNVDENVAREVDDCLLKESDKEEIMRKIFWKARLKAKEELNEQLADFQQKRTAGLGMLFGPSDAHLEESINDKSKELKIVETILVPKLEPFLTDMENDGVVAVDGRRFTTAAALGTILGKKFGLRGQHFSSLIERCPTFVSKDKSLKSKLIGKSRKVTLMGHHFVAHQYFTVTYCNHCQLIIWGIGPQGYQCSNCHLNIHRHCVKVLDENCPGPMVKKEKGNDRISKFMEKIRPENTRRKPSSLNLGTDRLRRQHEEKDDTGGTVADNELGSDRLSSSTSGGRGASGGGGGGSERRPDPVREAVEERMGGGRTNAASDPHHNDDDQHNQSHHELTHIAKPKSSAATINRSESYKERIPNKRQLRERRKTSDPNLSKTNNDVDIDNQTLTCHANSGSSSNSSLSTSRSLDSPSNSLEAVSGGGRGGAGGAGEGTNGGSVGVGTQWDSDLEAEPDPPDWTRQVPPDVLASLTTMEKKRQEVINELFHTERSHVRGLKVLDQVFFRPMRDQQILPPEQMQLLFANLDEMLAVHGHFNQSMKARRHEADPLIARVGDLILNMFDGAEGEVFQRAAATFCARQQIALEALKERRRKDQKLHSFLTDAEASPLCRRLQLKDIIPTGMLRLTKYPLLFENLAKYTAADSEEAGQVQRAVERSKQILNFVDKAVKEAEDQHRLAEIQRRLDKTPFDKADNPLATEFRNLDLTKHRLIHEGALVWRIASRPKPIDLHVLLLEDVIILLQKQDEKYVLKFYSATQFYSPVIKVSTVLVRTNAVDKTGLFLVNTSQNGAQIYDLVATSPQEKRKWFKHISEAAEAYKQRDGRNRRADAAAAAAAAAQQDLDASEHPAHDKTKDMEDATGSDLLSPPRGGATNGHDESPPPHSPTPSPSDASPSPSIQPPDTPTTDSIARRMGDSLSPSPSLSRKVAEPLRLTTAESALIQPSEVLVSQRPVLTAEPVLTPLEKLRRKDEAIKQALAEKQQLVADILHVPKDEFDTIAEIAGEPSSEKEASELILAAVNQANQLSAMVNEALRVSEEDAVSAGMTPRNGGASKAAAAAGVPAHKLNAIATSLNAQLTQLLSVLVQRDDERERLRRELQRSREQLHALHEQRAHHDDQPLSSSEPGAAVVEEAVQSTATEESSQESANPVNESTTAPTTAQEVFVDALSGEAESHLEAAAATSVGGGGETVADSVD